MIQSRLMLWLSGAMGGIATRATDASEFTAAGLGCLGALVVGLGWPNFRKVVCQIKGCDLNGDASQDRTCSRCEERVAASEKLLDREVA